MAALEALLADPALPQQHQLELAKIDIEMGASALGLKSRRVLPTRRPRFFRKR
jgi:hypothetical protein